MAVSAIPPTAPGGQTPEGHLQTSRRFLAHAGTEMDAGNRLQASEKISGAVAEAVKAIGEQRNWRHNTHGLRDAVVSQLGAELGRSTPEAQALYRGSDTAEKQHQSFFENTLYEDRIGDAIPVAEAFVDTVEQLMNQPPRPFTVARPLDAHRIAQLTGYAPALGVTDEQGFAKYTGEARQGWPSPT